MPRSKVEQVGDASQYFEISPDGMRISTPWQDGRVSVIDLATGSGGGGAGDRRFRVPKRVTCISTSVPDVAVGK